MTSRDAANGIRKTVHHDPGRIAGKVSHAMDASGHRPWVRAALLSGVAYFLIGRAFAAPASNVRVWRLAAWVASGAVFAAHIGYEHARLRHPPATTALHASLAVALGAFLLAVAGALRSLLVTSTFSPSWLLAFVVWPLATAIPAFLVALVTAAILARLSRRAGAG